MIKISTKFGRPSGRFLSHLIWKYFLVALADVLYWLFLFDSRLNANIFWTILRQHFYWTVRCTENTRILISQLFVHFESPFYLSPPTELWYLRLGRRQTDINVHQSDSFTELLRQYNYIQFFRNVCPKPQILAIATKLIFHLNFLHSYIKINNFLLFITRPLFIKTFKEKFPLKFLTSYYCGIVAIINLKQKKKSFFYHK